MTTTTTMTFELWQIVTLIGLFFGACGGAGKYLLAQTQRHLDEKFNSQEVARSANHLQVQHRLDAMEAAARQDASGLARIERDMLVMQAELPKEYVRREDYIRGQSVIESKLDGLALKLENVQLRQYGAGDRNVA